MSVCLHVCVCLFVFVNTPLLVPNSKQDKCDHDHFRFPPEKSNCGGGVAPWRLRQRICASGKCLHLVITWRTTLKSSRSLSGQLIFVSFVIWCLVYPFKSCFSRLKCYDWFLDESDHFHKHDYHLSSPFTKSDIRQQHSNPHCNHAKEFLPRNLEMV